MTNTDWVGWLSSALLIATIFKQVAKQWETRNFDGVSKWLYAGQLGAEIGFVVYSVLLRNWVFVFTNSTLLLLNLIGLALFFRARRRGGSPRPRALA